MQLWNDYEGKTIAGTYPLEKLLRPEGRSAFFSTSNGTGTPAEIRLIEALNDEQEILDRWRVVAEIKQTNLVTMKKYGQTEIDGTPLIYAVLEPTDMNLADVLRDRPLTIEETRQVATSLVAAIEALHARNLIHEHIEPVNILAAGEVIKLRSDCVREIPSDSEGSELKARDVNDLALSLRQALTQRKQSTGPLPAPFEEIVRNGTSGVWGLPQIAAALGVHSTSRTDATRSTAPAASVKTPAPVKAPAPAPVATPAAVAASAAVPRASVPAPAARPTSRLVDPEDSEEALSRKNVLWIAAAVVAVVLAFILFHFMHSGSASEPNSGAKAAPAVAPVAQPVTATPNKVVVRQDAKPSGARRDAKLAGPAGIQWRVVAYTYNHVSQARTKADTIAKQHASLKPEVFTPNGLPPYLVTLGGAMTRDEAIAFKKKALAAGFPHDIYAQNYSAKGR